MPLSIVEGDEQLSGLSMDQNSLGSPIRKVRLDLYLSVKWMLIPRSTILRNDDDEWRHRSQTR